ncbi:MAG: glycosyltransferase family 4 protein [Sedimentisphaerales bacterium]|nr:glycosyltransferase family 4 protein [Sedimentisphaerales bacterium]
MNNLASTESRPVLIRTPNTCGGARIRVAIVTDFPRDPEDPCGGVQAVSVHLVRGLSTLDGLELHVVTEDAECAAPKESMWGTVHVHRLPQSKKATLVNAIGAGRKQMADYLKRLAPDVIHAHDVYGLMVKGLSMPRVFTIHGQIYRDTRVSGGRLPRVRSWLWKQVELRGWADQPHVISISPYVREQLGGIVSGTIHNIDNPIGESCFRLERCEEQGRVFCAAALCARKNTLGLVQAFSRLIRMGVEAELRLSGGGDREYLDRVRPLIEEHGLERRVTLLGRATYATIQDEMARAAVFALLSLEENSPMAIEEAMAAGVPVVTSNRCGMPYMVREAESGFLVNPEDPDETAERLRQLLADDELRRAMGAKGREIALDRFHPARVAARTREVYLQAIRSFQRGRA